MSDERRNEDLNQQTVDSTFLLNLSSLSHEQLSPLNPPSVNESGNVVIAITAPSDVSSNPDDQLNSGGKSATLKRDADGGDETQTEDEFGSNQTVHHRSQDSLAVSKLSGWQRRLYYIVEEPRGHFAKAVNSISYVSIVILLVLVCLQSLPQYITNEGIFPVLSPYFFPIETIVTVWWTVELGLRFFASPEKLRFFTRPFPIIDLITILPYFLIFVNNMEFQNFARLLRVFRIVKAVRLAKYSSGIQLGFRAIVRSTDAIWMFLIFVMLSTLMSASAIYWAERGIWNDKKRVWIREDGTDSPFYSIPQGIYWAIVTLTTVGYGDMYPITALGKTVACLTMFFSVLTIALPTSIIGSNFMAEWQIFQRSQLQKKMQKLKNKSATAASDDGNAGASSATLKHSSDKKLKETVREQNMLLLTTIAEIQEKLSDVNPTQYYQKYKETKQELEKSQAQVMQLQKDVARWKRECKALLKLRRLNGPNEHISPALDVQTSVSLHVSSDQSLTIPSEKGSSSVGISGAKKFIQRIKTGMPGMHAEPSVGDEFKRERRKSGNIFLLGNAPPRPTAEAAAPSLSLDSVSINPAPSQVKSEPSSLSNVSNK